MLFVQMYHIIFKQSGYTVTEAQIFESTLCTCVMCRRLRLRRREQNTGESRRRHNKNKFFFNVTDT